MKSKPSLKSEEWKPFLQLSPQALGGDGRRRKSPLDGAAYHFFLWTLKLWEFRFGRKTRKFQQNSVNQIFNLKFDNFDITMLFKYYLRILHNL